jgi:hypothetical protein
MVVACPYREVYGHVDEDIPLLSGMPPKRRLKAYCDMAYRTLGNEK